jgi:hypothetical protein
MVDLLAVTYKRPTRLGEPAKMISQQVIGQEDKDGREIDEAWVDFILDGMRERGMLPHQEGELKTV